MLFDSSLTAASGCFTLKAAYITKGGNKAKESGHHHSVVDTN